MTFTCDGMVGSWRFNASSAGTFHSAVWRRYGEAEYVLVGKNQITVTTAGIQSWQVPENERINVTSGDCIGVHYDFSMAGLVGYTTQTSGKVFEAGIYDNNIATFNGVLNSSTLTGRFYTSHINRAIALRGFIFDPMTTTITNEAQATNNVTATTGQFGAVTTDASGSTNGEVSGQTTVAGPNQSGLSTGNECVASLALTFFMYLVHYSL